MKKHRFAWLPLGAEVLCFGGMAFTGLPKELVLEPSPQAVDAAVLAVERRMGPFWILFAAIAVLGALNLIQALRLGLAGERSLLRQLGLWGRLALSLCQGGFLVFLGLAVLMGAVAFSGLLGPLGLLGVGLVGIMGLGWLWFVGLGPSACLIAYLWSGVRAGEVRAGRAVLQTLLLLIPVVDVTAAVILYRTSPGNGTRPEGSSQEPSAS